MYGVLKKNLKKVILLIIKSMGLILGVCGDINRNVMFLLVFYKNCFEYEYVKDYVNKIVDLLIL